MQGQSLAGKEGPLDEQDSAATAKLKDIVAPRDSQPGGTP